MPSAPTPTPAKPPLWRNFVWVAIALGALAAAFFIHRQRIQRVDHVSASPYWSVDAPVADANSPTGYAESRRQLVVPGRSAASYAWIMRAQQAVAGSYTPHRVDHDNFPHGRASPDTAPYRWWLTGVAWLDHTLTGRSLPLAVEHSARYADPLLHLLLAASAAIFVGWHFGGAAAAAVAVALTLFFPLAGSFVAGAPDHRALGWTLFTAGVLPLLAGLQGGRARLWFALAGIATGLGIWNDCLTGEPLLLGILAGGLLVAWLRRSDANAPVAPWRTWGLATGATCLLAWLVEYFPATSGPAIPSIHPLHALLGFSLGELLHRFSLAVRPHTSPANWRDRTVLAGALGLASALPIARLLAKDGRFLASDPQAHELANLAFNLRAASLATWMPLGLIALVALLLLRSPRVAAGLRRGLALALGPVLVTVVLACLHARWWNGCDAALAALLVVVVASTETAMGGWRWVGRGLVAWIALPGILLLPPPPAARGDATLGETETLAVVERDLAHWLVHQHGAEPTVVFTTPGLSEALAYYGNIKGIVSYDPANEAGLSAATRVTSASTPTEAMTLLEGRRVTHLIVPSWDPSLERFAQLGRHLTPDAGLPPDTLIAQLAHASLPTWLRPMTYHTPSDLGAGNYAVQVLALQPEQDEVLTLCRTADYLVEMGQLEQAAAFREKLRQHPRSLPALAALAQINQAIGDRAGYEESLQQLLPYVSRRAGKTLTVDRRISLAALLIQAKQTDATRDQMQQCLAALDAAALRELTTGEIVRLLAIADILKLPLPDPQLRQLALSLVPPTLRARIEKSASR